MSTNRRKGKVLLFCPTYYVKGKSQLQQRTKEAIEHLQFDGELDVIIRHDGDASHVLTAQEPNTINQQYNYARSVFLDGGYDSLLTVEHDMIPPPDGLQKLWNMDVDIAYGVYTFRHGSNIINAYQHIPDSINIGTSLSNSRHTEELREALDAEIWKVDGVGLGFTLIKRHVLEKQAFLGKTPDTQFAREAKANGYEQYAHFGVCCGHIDPKTGEVLEVDETQGVATHRMVAVMGNSDFVFTGGHRVKKGKKRWMPRYLAEQHARWGGVTIIHDPDVIENARCKGVTRAGKPCKLAAVEGSEYCHLHRKK